MGKIRFYKIKYKNKILKIGYCDYENFEWCGSKIKGKFILFINSKYSFENKRKILHRFIREIS